MFKKSLLAVLAAVAFMGAAMAAVDVNKADQSQLEAIKGVGPVTAQKIIDERKKGSFKDWDDLVKRVQGVGEVNAGKFSEAGLTVNGSARANAPAKPEAAKDAAAADKADAKAADTKADAKVTETKADAKADAKVTKATAKADEKAVDAKADKAAAKADAKIDVAKADAKADAAKAKADAKAEKAKAKADAKAAKEAAKADAAAKK